MYRYIGNKTKLLPHITNRIREMIGDTGTVADIMAGTGSVALELKKNGYTVVASDVMTYSYHHLVTNLQLDREPPFEGLIHSGIVDEKCTTPYQEVLKFLNNLSPKKSFFYREFSPAGTPLNGCPSRKYFTSENAEKIDAIREKINEWIQYGLITPNEESLLKHTLIMAVNEIANDDVKDDDFDVEGELEKPPVTKSGDLWLLGNHRLICGDSTKEDTYTRLMDGKKANLVVTDPPYNVNYEGSAGKIKNDNLDNDKFYQFLFDAFQNAEKAMADDASIYVFHADTEGLNFRKAFADAGFYLSGTCIWKKQSLVLGRSPYQWQHEPVLFGWKKNGKHKWYSDRKQTTIWEFDKPKKNGDHPTMKPVPLIAYPIKNSSVANCIVLDPFGGSGSTLIACEQTNRIKATFSFAWHSAKWQRK